MKSHNYLVMFLKCLLTFQLFESLTCVTANDYIYSVEESYSDIGVEQNGNGVEIDGFVPLELNNDQKRTFTSARIIDIDMGAIWDQHQQSESIRNGSVVFDGNYNGNPTSVVDYNEGIFQSKLSRNGDFVFGSLLTAIGLFSLVGNGCILVVFHCRRRRLTPAEILLVNLGIVDVLLFFASYPLTIISSFRHRWDFGELGCSLYAFVCYFLGLASIFSITTIALIRYWKTCTPVRGNRITCWTSYKAIGWGYFFALIWSVPPLIGFGSYGPEPYGLSCTLDWVARDNASRLYIILVSIFCVFLPLLLVMFCYCRIILLVRQSDALVRNNGVQKKNMRVSDIQLTWISALVSLGFIIGWGPYTVVSLWASFRGEVMLPMWATPLPVILAKSSIAYNPFIYIFFTARYREDFISLCRYWIRSYSKVTTGKSSITRRGPSSQNTNGNTANTSMKVSPGYSRNSSLLTRQPTTTTATNSYNNLTPNHATSYPKQDEQPVPSQTHLDQEADKQNNFTANVLNSINPSVQRSSQDLSIVIVGEVYANNSRVITIINGVPPSRKLCPVSFPTFQKNCKVEHV